MTALKTINLAPGEERTLTNPPLVDGKAGLPPWPWSKQDRPDTADGLTVTGGVFHGRGLRYSQIPGTALTVTAYNDLSNETGIYRFAPPSLEDVWVSQAHRGILWQVADGQLERINASGIVGDALTLDGPGTVVDVSHIWGARRACVVVQPAELHTSYHESAWIGTHVLPGATGTTFDGLNIGPGTCWYRGVKIEAHGVTVNGLKGSVQGETTDPEKRDIAGVEIAPGTVNQFVEGELVILGDGSDGVILRGHRGKLDLKGGWNAPAKATFVRVAEAVTGWTVEIRGSGDGGTVLDLSGSGLDRVNGLGNEFKLKWSGTATRVIYPNNSRAYNLAPGTQLWIDGVLQVTPQKKAA